MQIHATHGHRIYELEGKKNNEDGFEKMAGTDGIRYEFITLDHGMPSLN